MSPSDVVANAGTTALASGSESDRSLLPALLKVGFIGFGGGSALIPVMHRELVAHRGLVDDAAFTRHTVVANITPGALPVKLAALASLHLGRPRSVVNAGLVVAAPGTLLAVAILAWLSAAGPEALRALGFVSVGINAFILAVLWHYVTGVVAGHRHRAVALAVVVATFVLTGARATARLLQTVTDREAPLDVPVLTAVHVIVAAIVLTSAATAIRGIRLRTSTARVAAAGERSARRGWVQLRRASMALLATLASALLLSFAAGGVRLLRLTSLVLASAVTSFGGGEAYVAVADGYFVEGGYVDSVAFYQRAVPVANALPGPILVKLAALVGFIAAGPGWLGWTAALTCAVAAICGTLIPAVVVAAGYEAVQHSWSVTTLSSWVLPVVCGLLATTAVSMLDSSASVATEVGWRPAPALLGVILAVVVIVFIQRRASHRDVVLVLAAGTASWAIFNAWGGR